MKRSLTSGALAVLLALAGLAHAAVNIGAPAPDFALRSASGKIVKLSDFKGKLVVLEWVNEGCPFVHKQYDSDNMQKLQKEYTAKGEPSRVQILRYLRAVRSGRNGSTMPYRIGHQIKREVSITRRSPRNSRR